MRICQTCRRENPDDRDFCECGEYLRWEPTGFTQAVTPDAAVVSVQPAAPAPAPAFEPPAPPPPAAAPQQQPPPPVAPATESRFETYTAPPPPAPPQDEPEPTPPAPPEGGNGHALVPTPPPVAAAPPPPTTGSSGTLVHGALPAPPPPQATPEPPAMASITLKLPDEDPVKEGVLALGVEPGGRERVQALIRNQSGIVDNYELSIRRLPDSWWTIYPNTVYLVPFGTRGTYEQQVEIHLHPPRTPEAEARLWDLEPRTGPDRRPWRDYVDEQNRRTSGRWQQLAQFQASANFGDHATRDPFRGWALEVSRYSFATGQEIFSRYHADRQLGPSRPPPPFARKMEDQAED